MGTNSTTLSERKAGVFYVTACYAAWGILPLYWHILGNIPAMEILAHRIFWSFVVVVGFLLMKKQIRQVIPVLKDRKSRYAILIASVLITCNWFIYIWAINAGHVIESSLGYYINPLFSVLLGMIVLKERLNFWQLLSLLIASLGVGIVAVQYGRIPWIAFVLAITFGLYGLVKKVIPVDSMVGLTVETLFVTPIAMIYLLFLQFQGTSSLGSISLLELVVLVGTGVITALPLFWFAQGAKRIPLSLSGFIQYLSPTIMFLLGIFFFKEPFSKPTLICFSLIWCALLLFSCSHTGFMQRLQPKWFQPKIKITKEV